ncbi:hypothetical protein EON81_11505 [bacterium]|nr:MAG: hypothetical protein EON81_11505 [bacterium]
MANRPRLEARHGERWNCPRANIRWNSAIRRRDMPWGSRFRLSPGWLGPSESFSPVEDRGRRKSRQNRTMASTVLEPEVLGPESGDRGRWMTLIHNNESNSVDEVMMILILATGCDEDEAFMEMWEAHTFGKAACHFGSQEECQEVAEVISRIGVQTEVVPEWEDE